MATKGKNKAKDRRAARRAEGDGDFGHNGGMLGAHGASSYRGGRRAQGHRRSTVDDDHNPDMVRHAELWSKYMAEGMSSEDARRKADEDFQKGD